MGAWQVSGHMSPTFAIEVTERDDFVGFSRINCLARHT